MTICVVLLLLISLELLKVLLKVRADPAAYGFREIERPALLEPLRPQAAPDTTGVLWWDGWGHLSSAFHGLLADEAVVVAGA